MVSIEQMCRDLLGRAVADGLVCVAEESPLDLQQLSAGDLTGVANLLTAFLRDAVAAEQEACAGVCKQAVRLWDDNPRIQAVLRAVAEDIRTRGGPTP